MGQQHVLMLRLSVGPSRQTRTYKQLAIERVGNTIIQLSLADCRMRSKIDCRMLSSGVEVHDLVRPLNEEMSKQKPQRHLSGNCESEIGTTSGVDKVKRKRFGRGEVI